MVTLINPPSRLHYLRSVRSPANLGALGDSVLCPGPVKSQLDSLAAQLLQASNDLTATQNQVVAASQAAQDMSAEGQQLLSQRQDLETMISALTAGYRTFCGTVPPGLSGLSCGACSRRGGYAMGLGLLPAIPITTAAALIAALAAAIAAWWIVERMMKDSVNSKLAAAEQTRQQNIGYAQQQLQQAIASGDTAAAAQWQAAIDANKAQPPAGGQSLTDFISANWIWIAAAVGGVFLVKEL